MLCVCVCVCVCVCARVRVCVCVCVCVCTCMRVWERETHIFCWPLAPDLVCVCECVCVNVCVCECVFACVWVCMCPFLCAYIVFEFRLVFFRNHVITHRSLALRLVFWPRRDYKARSSPGIVTNRISHLCITNSESHASITPILTLPWL